jgi:hypothetical protein
MSSPYILVTPSTLMHASLAYWSPESMYFDSLISRHSMCTLRVRSISRTTILSIPPELLLLIRSHLHIAITTQLTSRTAHALRDYEVSLRELLCPDCCFYNDDVFGSNVWNWEGFSGPCSCDFIGKDRSRDSVVVQKDLSPQPFPKQFIDRQHWVETYLTREYSHLVSSSPSPLSSSKFSPSVGVWSVVDEVLREFGCMVVRDSLPSHSLTRSQGMFVLLRNLGRSSPWLYRPTHQAVVPLPFTGRAKEMDRCSREIILNRVRRELCLDHELEFEGAGCDSGQEESDAVHHSRPAVHAFGDPSFEGKSTKSYPTARIPLCACTLLLPFVQAVSACITMPLAFVVTVVCFYCKPGALRLL